MASFGVTLFFQTSLFSDVFVFDVFIFGRLLFDVFFRTSFFGTSFAVASYNGICPYSWPAGLLSGRLFFGRLFLDLFIFERLCF